MATITTKKLFTVDDYHRMVGAGILSESDRVELIHGEILTMSPIGTRHMAAVDRANRLFVTTLGDSAIVRVGGSVRLDRFNEPQPDIVLLRPRDDFYVSATAGASDIFLIIEVADSSLEYDQGIKASLYAERGVSEYWIVDLKSGVVMTHSGPAGMSFRTVREYRRGDSVAPQLLPTCNVQIASLLP